ncbi:hypothetical protein IKU74_06680 [bacterium]|nr:hypothetical protein [bacterium]
MILGITPNIKTHKTSMPKCSNNVASPLNKRCLTADTVSFTGNKGKLVGKATNTFEDLFKDYYEEVLPQREIMGRRFVNALKSVAEELKEFGFEFPKAIEDKAVKGQEAYIDKWRRSGSRPMDSVRSTLYNKNLYDLNLILTKLLPAMEDNGYKLLLVPEERTGRRVKNWMLDLDFRLKDIAPEMIAKLPPEIQKCISKPQKSGYEDIQMRFVDTTLKPKDRIPQELIILFGENYSKAKNDEHYYVYEITRDLKDKLSVSQIESPQMHSHEKRIQDNIKILRDLLNNTISKPLYINAKAQDFYGEEPTLPVGLSKAQVSALTGLMEGIRSRIVLYYKAELDKLKNASLVEEVEKLLSTAQKSSEKTDKTVSISEVLESNEQLIENLKKQRNEDLKIVKDAQKRLMETIEKFGEKD